MLAWQKTHHGTIKAQGAADTLPTPGSQSRFGRAGPFLLLAGCLQVNSCNAFGCRILAGFRKGAGFRFSVENPRERLHLLRQALAAVLSYSFSPHRIARRLMPLSPRGRRASTAQE